MVAVPEAGTSDAAGLFTAAVGVPAHRRRLVAVAVSPMELLRPGSDLVRLIEDAAYVDLLIACEDAQVEEPSPVGVLASADGPSWDDGLSWDDESEWDDESDDAEDDGDDDADEVRRVADGLGLPDLHLHRLGLRPPLGPSAEPDLVAALSELVGFDPEPGVYCLAPTPAATDPSRVVVDRAVQRIAKVYGLPLLRYRCLELSVVEDDEQG
jgi:hypothetical protein